MNNAMIRRRPPRLRQATWTGATRKLGSAKYRVFDDGSYRRANPKVKGKAARKADKRRRRRVAR